MFIKSLLVSTALFQSVVPSGYHSIDPLKVIQHEFQHKFGISMTDPHSPPIQNFQQEIIEQQATFTQEMPFLGALSIETSLDPQQIRQAMLPLINQYPGTEIRQILQKVLEPSHVAIPVSYGEAIVFSALFESIFPGYRTDLYQIVMKEQTPNQVLPILYKTSANPGKNAIESNIKLFSQMNGLWRAIIPNTIVPQVLIQPNGRVHIEYKYIKNVEGDKSISSANPDPAKKPQKDDKRSKSAKNGKPNKADNKGKSASSVNPSGKQGNPGKDAKVDKGAKNGNPDKGDKSGKGGDRKKPQKDDKVRKDTNGSKSAENGKANKADNKGKRASSANPSGKQENPDKDAKVDKVGTGSKSAKGVKSGKGGDGVSDKKKNRKPWIIGGIIAALVIILAACFGVYKALLRLQNRLAFPFEF